MEHSPGKMGHRKNGMDMIQEIHIQNFQSHKDTQLALDPGMNVIIGASDSGKTAIIRALRWVNWNRPSGEAFRSHWGGDTVVRILTEKDQVERIKGKENAYSLGAIHSEKFTEFKAFGQDVPVEIQKVLNLDEINLQSQLDRPFLLDSSAGEVAAHFNRVANLDQIDTATKNIQGWIRSLEQTARALEMQDNQLSQDVEKYTYLEKMEIEIEVLENMQGELDKYRKQSTSLSKLIQETTATENGINEVFWCEQAEKEYQYLEAQKKEYDTLQTKHQSLLSVIDELQTTQQDISEVEHTIPAEALIDSLLQDKQQRRLLDEQRQSIHSLASRIQKSISNGTEQAEKIIRLEKEFKANFPDICPLCETVITKPNAKNKK